MEQKQTKYVLEKAQQTIEHRGLANSESPVLLMVSGGSDSTALTYIALELFEKGVIGPIAVLHVNHQLRGKDADDDQAFVQQLADMLHIPLFVCEVDVAAQAQHMGENVEAVARHERYLAANEALESLCRHESIPLSEGRIFTAHTQDDRVENFYMRSIVGTGPGGFRSMKYTNGPVVRPLMDLSREDLRGFIQEREHLGEPMACDENGNLWREDATNAHTDKFRAFVRHEIVTKAKERNPQLLETLCRTMNLIADEDDMTHERAREIGYEMVAWESEEDWTEGCVIAPQFGEQPIPLQRRVIMQVLQSMLGPDARVETASVEAVIEGWKEGKPISGRTENIQGDLAVSSNKQGVRIESMSTYRARRKKD